MAIPPPRTGAVIRYATLWKHEQAAGIEEASKDRPAAVVLAHHDDISRRTIVYVLPITRSPPEDPSAAVEIPAQAKRTLRLDGERSWIICSEVNEFVWPGHDLRPVPGSDPPAWEYGMLPHGIFEKARSLFLAYRRRRLLRIAKRD